MSNWLTRNHADLIGTSKNGMLNVTEYTMRDWLDEVLAKKSPRYIVKISDLKNDLDRKERDKRHGDEQGWDSISQRQLPNEIANLKQQLAEAEAERRKARHLKT